MGPEAAALTTAPSFGTAQPAVGLTYTDHGPSTAAATSRSCWRYWDGLLRARVETHSGKLGRGSRYWVQAGPSCTSKLRSATQATESQTSSCERLSPKSSALRSDPLDPSTATSEFETEAQLPQSPQLCVCINMSHQVLNPLDDPAVVRRISLRTSFVRTLWKSKKIEILMRRRRSLKKSFHHQQRSITMRTSTGKRTSRNQWEPKPAMTGSDPPSCRRPAE